MFQKSIFECWGSYGFKGQTKCWVPNDLSLYSNSDTCAQVTTVSLLSLSSVTFASRDLSNTKDCIQIAFRLCSDCDTIEIALQ